jgi:hypothetical protein
MARQSGKGHGCGCFFGLWTTVGDGGFPSLGGLPPKPPLSGRVRTPDPPKGWHPLISNLGHPPTELEVDPKIPDGHRDDRQ